MNKYLEKIAEQDKPKHDWKPAAVGGALEVPLGVGLAWTGKKIADVAFKGRHEAKLIGVLGGAAAAGEADYLQRRAEKKSSLIKQALKHVPGVGKHNSKPDSDFNKKELALGRKVEHEHVSKYQPAEDIAKDHLSEIPDYYSRLVKMEKSAKLAHKLKKLREEVTDAGEHAAYNAPDHVEHKEKKHKKKGKKERD